MSWASNWVTIGTGWLKELITKPCEMSDSSQPADARAWGGSTEGGRARLKEVITKPCEVSDSSQPAGVRAWGVSTEGGRACALAV